MGAYPAITELVPHAAPILALEELVDADEGRACARLVVRADDPFARDGTVDAVVTLEYMAQAVAACLGWEARRAGRAVRVGMVVACREMRLERSSLPVGSELRIEVRRVHGTEASSHFDAEVRDSSGARVASATLTLVHGEAPPA
jgi:predicted hotdog family 3-hydroxylacyl-ACP dehydratase